MALGNRVLLPWDIVLPMVLTSLLEALTLVPVCSGWEGQESSLALGMRVARKPSEVLEQPTLKDRVALRKRGPKWLLHRGSSLLQGQLACTAHTSMTAIVTWGKVSGRCQGRSDLPLLPTPPCAPFHGAWQQCTRGCRKTLSWGPEGINEQLHHHS